MKNEQDFSGEIKREMAVPTKGTADCGKHGEPRNMVCWDPVLCNWNTKSGYERGK